MRIPMVTIKCMVMNVRERVVQKDGKQSVVYDLFCTQDWENVFTISSQTPVKKYAETMEEEEFTCTFVSGTADNGNKYSMFYTVM